MVLGIRLCLFVNEGHELAKDSEIPRRWRVDTLVGHPVCRCRGKDAAMRSKVRIDGTICIGGVGGVANQDGGRGVSYHHRNNCRVPSFDLFLRK